MSKLWGGRFEKETDRDVERFSASLAVDSRLWQADLRASQAHARMLGRIGAISTAESATLVDGLEQVSAALISGSSQFHADAEDVHSELERLLTEQVGAVGGKLHTARSRNDQVATACRLYLREECAGLELEIEALQRWIVEASEGHLETVMPGLTHLQHAQPVSLAHHLLAYFWMLERDKGRVQDTARRLNQLPLGSAALAGTSFALDRDGVAQELGFASITENSLDAVSDRDFVVEFLSSCALIMTHLSRLSEEIILWCTPEFGFIQLDDSVTTGSSLMPQKKNPDVAELIRGKVGRVNGALIGALTMLKGLPLSYNRDLQEDKEFLFNGLDTTRGSLRLMHLMLKSAVFRKERMAQAARGDFSTTTDLADYLVRQGMPFRQAHEVTGRVVQACIKSGQVLEDLALPALRDFSELFEADVLPQIQALAVMQARTSPGGTAPSAVRQQIAKARAALS